MAGGLLVSEEFASRTSKAVKGYEQAQPDIRQGKEPLLAGAPRQWFLVAETPYFTATKSGSKDIAYCCQIPTGGVRLAAGTPLVYVTSRDDDDMPKAALVDTAAGDPTVTLACFPVNLAFMQGRPLRGQYIAAFNVGGQWWAEGTINGTMFATAISVSAAKAQVQAARNEDDENATITLGTGFVSTVDVTEGQLVLLTWIQRLAPLDDATTNYSQGTGDYFITWVECQDTEA